MQNTKSSISFRGILLLLTIGVWVIVLQNAGIIPSKQRVYVDGGKLKANISGTVSIDGDVGVYGSVDVDNTVDVNISRILNRPAASRTSYTIDGQEYSSLDVSLR